MNHQGHDPLPPTRRGWAAAGTALDVRPDIEADPWSDLDGEAIEHGSVTRIGLLRAATSQGRASVALIVRLDDGRLVVAETTWALFHTAARALAASPVAAEEV